MIHPVGTGPQKRLSSDSPRLSPIMNQWPGGTLIATMTSRHTRLDSKFAFTGGGNAEFIPQIQAAMRTARRPDHLYQVVPPEVARFANVAGLFWVLNIRKRPLTVAR